MEITKKYFDKKFDGVVATQNDFKKGLESLTKYLDGKFEKVDQKFDQQTRELKDYVHESFEVQQFWIDERFKELITVYDVRERVSLLEKEVLKLKLHK